MNFPAEISLYIGSLASLDAATARALSFVAPFQHAADKNIFLALKRYEHLVYGDPPSLAPNVPPRILSSLSFLDTRNQFNREPFSGVDLLQFCTPFQSLTMLACTVPHSFILSDPMPSIVKLVLSHPLNNVEEAGDIQRFAYLFPSVTVLALDFLNLRHLFRVFSGARNLCSKLKFFRYLEALRVHLPSEHRASDLEPLFANLEQHFKSSALNLVLSLPAMKNAGAVLSNLLNSRLGRLHKIFVLEPSLDSQDQLQAPREPQDDESKNECRVLKYYGSFDNGIDLLQGPYWEEVNGMAADG
ncbi:hypothetical protein DL96DRAFT_1809129 [Flagelloscypha sp. PMI_526]|nr:hypothetical protein DL96DRAFT_1809129 [Flagelloscypha sp. PMI_526]